MRERRASRVIPKNPITVTIDVVGPRTAYGVVMNISEGGACIWTDGRFDVGHGLDLKLNLAQDTAPLDTHGVVVWGGPVRPSGEGTLRYGVKWTESSPATQQRLRHLIARAS
jgi:Tfp pilus assembly protein PilZ